MTTREPREKPMKASGRVLLSGAGVERVDVLGVGR